MNIQNKQDLLALGRLKTEAVQIDDNEIIISEMGAIDSQKLYTDKRYQSNNGDVNTSLFTAALLARCIVDDNGERLFNDDDEKIIARWPRKLFDTLSLVAMRLNAMDATVHKETVKNSGPSTE